MTYAEVCAGRLLLPEDVKKYKENINENIEIYKSAILAYQKVIENEIQDFDVCYNLCGFYALFLSQFWKYHENSEEKKKKDFVFNKNFKKIIKTKKEEEDEFYSDEEEIFGEEFRIYEEVSLLDSANEAFQKMFGLKEEVNLIEKIEEMVVFFEKCVLKDKKVYNLYSKILDNNISHLSEINKELQDIKRARERIEKIKELYGYKSIQNKSEKSKALEAEVGEWAKKFLKHPEIRPEKKKKKMGRRIYLY